MFEDEPICHCSNGSGVGRQAATLSSLSAPPRATIYIATDLKATEQPIDTATAVGKCFLDMLGVFAEFETNLRKERQLEGKEAGVYKGRPASIDAARVRSTQGRMRGGAAADWGGDADILGRRFCSEALTTSRNICSWLALSCSISCPAVARSRAIAWSNCGDSGDRAAAVGATPSVAV